MKKRLKYDTMKSEGLRPSSRGRALSFGAPENGLELFDDDDIEVRWGPIERKGSKINKGREPVDELMQQIKGARSATRENMKSWRQRMLIWLIRLIWLGMMPLFYKI
jgi:hypothetical protein